MKKKYPKSVGQIQIAISVIIPEGEDRTGKKKFEEMVTESFSKLTINTIVSYKKFREPHRSLQSIE